MTPKKPIDGTLLAAFTRFADLSCYWHRNGTPDSLALSELQERNRLAIDLPELIKRLTAFASLNTEPRFEAEARVVVEPPREDQGWRMLELGEKTIKGDEWREDSKSPWKPCKCFWGGIRQSDVGYFRRRVTPPATEYRMLEAGEMILPGDEWLCDDAWLPVREINEPLCLENVGHCRRKVVSNDTAGQGKEMKGKRDHEAASKQSGASEEGWRMLEIGEHIKEGDEVLGKHKWHPATSMAIGVPVQPGFFSHFRRRIPAKHPESDRAALGIANLIERETM